MHLIITNVLFIKFGDLLDRGVFHNIVGYVKGQESVHVFVGEEPPGGEVELNEVGIVVIGCEGGKHELEVDLVLGRGIVEPSSDVCF